jgi:hypothetical protein
MNDFTKIIARAIGRHFISLSCVQYPPDNTQMRILLFSGFVIEVTGEWFYVTAGHILRDISTALQNGYKFDIWRLGDQTAGNKFGDSAIPYSFELEKWIILEDKESGLDYATVHIDNFYRRQLEANGVTALSKRAWASHSIEHDYWALFGIPSESLSYDNKTLLKARVVSAPLIPTEKPANVSAKMKNQFYAKMIEGSEQFIRDLDGMSGAPVFSIKRENDLCKYSVIGVQSGLLEPSNVLTICPFVSFGMLLEKAVKNVLLSESQSNSTPCVD